MKKFAATLFVLMATLGQASADVVSGIDATASFEPMPAGAKIYLTDTATKSYDRLEQMLTSAGYQVVERRNEADFFVSIFKLQMLVEKDGKPVYVDLYNLPEFKDFTVPASVEQDEVKVSGADTGASGRVRGVFDMDGGVIAQGSRLTGSGAGGVAVGMVGALIGGIFDRAASKQSDPPKDMVFARGAITKNGATQGAKFILGVGSTQSVTAGTLFDEALKRYVRTVTGGFQKPAKEL